MKNEHEVKKERESMEVWDESMDLMVEAIAIAMNCDVVVSGGDVSFKAKPCPRQPLKMRQDVHGPLCSNVYK